MKCVLAAEAAADMSLILVLLTVMVVFLGVLVVRFIRERDARAAAERRAAEAEHALAAHAGEAQAEAANAQRTQVMFDQHKRINQLTIDKLEAEVQLMQAQLGLRAGLKDREEAGREAHELMVEKTRLEIDSLRLHIAELRKRLEDWNSD